MGLCTGEQGLSWTETLMPTPPQPTPRRNQQQQSGDQQRLECPRCKSTNTKFCYYNNYNKSQPRHYCKGCKRHWTKGGTLRNVPVGGGRKNKKFKPSSHATITTTTNTTTSTNIAKTLFGTIPSSYTTFQQNGTINNGVFPAGRLFPGSENRKFAFSSGGSLDYNMVSSSSTISNQHKDHGAYGYGDGDGEGDNKNRDSSFESTITTNSSIFSHDQPWQGPLSTTSEVPSYWNWNDIETLISADLDTTWDDDLDIKF